MDLIDQLGKIFYPESVAVVGASATPGKVGFRCMESLVKSGFKGRIYL